MKKTVSLIILLISLAASAANKSSVTELAPPTEQQVATAIKILQEALGAQVKGDLKTYENKIERAQKFLQKREVEVKYNAQIYCGDALISDWESAKDCDIMNGLCYIGEITVAKDLLNEYFERRVFGSDEEWLEDARIKKSKILYDFVDGPNEYRDTYSAGSCD